MLDLPTESEFHLWQRAIYRATDGTWHEHYWDAVEHSKDELTWDVAAILSILSLCYACGDRTLIKEIVRRPWLSKLRADGECELSEIPTHGRFWIEPAEIAENLEKLLYNEALEVCRGRDEIYVQLSGGLDSRIVAGIVARLYRDGELPTKPVAVTWGMPDCRDVEYARAASEILGFELIHVDIGPGDLIENIEPVISQGNLFPSPHLHRIPWFECVSEDALVLSGCYGDSVGRAEFSKGHLLELSFLKPSNSLGLLTREACAVAYEGVRSDLHALHARTPGEPGYVLCEHEGQGHYMRGEIAQAMNVIGDHCTVYHMFTHPDVYSYMWSIHPVQRDNRVYEHLLERLDEKLARLPWARNNRALRGKTIGAKSGLRKSFHAYRDWISGPVYDHFRDYMDPDWFADTGIFAPDNIDAISGTLEAVRGRQQLVSFRPYEMWMWLVGFRRFAERCSKLGKTLKAELGDPSLCPDEPVVVSGDARNLMRRIMGKSKTAVSARDAIRRARLKRRALVKYPPVRK